MLLRKKHLQQFSADIKKKRFPSLSQILEYDSKDEHYKEEFSIDPNDAQISNFSIDVKRTRSFSQYHNGLISRAKRRKLNFDLNMQDLSELIQLPCFKCGAEPSIPFRWHDVFLANKVRPRNYGEGYTYLNMEVICPKCAKCNRKHKQINYNQKDNIQSL